MSNLKGTPNPDGSLLVDWQAPVNLNATKICYYKLEIWKQDMPHSSYYMQVFTPKLKFLFGEKTVVNDRLIIKAWAINTDVDLEGHACYSDESKCVGRFTSDVVLANYYNPIDSNLNCSNSIRLGNIKYLFVNLSLLFVVYLN